MWSFLPIFYLSLIISTTSAVADTSKSLWVPQIILLEYLPVSTTCRGILNWGLKRRRSLENGDKSPPAGITHWSAGGTITAAAHAAIWQLGCGPICTALNDSPTKLNHTLTGNGQGSKSSYSKHAWRGSSTGSLQVLAEKNRQDNNQEIICRFFTVMIGCFALQGHKCSSVIVW